MHDKLTSAAYGASGAAVWLGSLDWSTISMVGGLLLGVLTFAVNTYYKHKSTSAYIKSLNSGEHPNEFSE